MKVIQRHKGLVIVCFLTLILLIVIGVIFSKMLFGDKASTYGDRLTGIVKLDAKIDDKITKDYLDKKEVSDITLRVQGKIIYVTINFQKGTKLDTAKEIATKVIEYYDEEAVDYYDFGFFLIEDTDQTDEKNTGFIVAGTKIPDKKGIKWTK